MSELTNRFRSLSENLCDLLEQEGMVVRPYHLASLPFFQALAGEEQESTLAHLESYFRICQNTKERGGNLREGRSLVRHALDYYQLQVDPRVFELVHPRNVFEFYSPNQTQYFRTVNCFEYTSYTIEDLYSRSWLHLYDRDERITSKILEMAFLILSEKTKEMIIPDMPEHLLVERASLERLQVPVQFKCLAPLTQNGKTVGVLSVVRSGGLGIEVLKEELEGSDS